MYSKINKFFNFCKTSRFYGILPTKQPSHLCCQVYIFFNNIIAFLLDTSIIDKER